MNTGIKPQENRQYKTKGLLLLRLLSGLLGAVMLLWGAAPLVISGITNVGVFALLGAGFAFAAASLFFEPFCQVCRTIWKRKGIRMICLIILSIVLVLVLLFVGVSCGMLYAAAKTPPENATVIVLGAAIRGESPSRMLAARLDAASKYLDSNPEAVCIVSGGQGADEDYTEAYVMKKYLMEKGVAEERILMEDRSTNTYENIDFSEKLIEEHQLSRQVVISTQEFHQLRAQSFARQAGLEDVGACTCRTPFYMLGCYWIREFAAVCRMFLLGY